MASGYFGEGAQTGSIRAQHLVLLGLAPDLPPTRRHRLIDLDLKTGVIGANADINVNDSKHHKTVLELISRSRYA
jgi:hypothetical protein